ncbi:MAG: lysophospholipid acyltransferase family protein [Candidatus Sumerlaeaceae bacterium]|nr:lysophospholipid acyltransferase family protein [Candidatus Sumerlaeaceae bacterium]
MTLPGRWAGFDLSDLLIALALRLPARLAVGLLVGAGGLRLRVSVRSGALRRLEEHFTGYVAMAGSDQSPRELALHHRRLMWLNSCAPAVVAFHRQALPASSLQVAGWEHVEQALAGGRGAVLASAHVGIPGLPSAWLIRRGIKVLTLRRPYLEPLAHTAHGRNLLFGAEAMFVNWEAAPAAPLKRAIEVLRENGVASYLLDGIHGRRGATVTLFGKRVELRTGFAEVARLAGAPIIPAFAVEEKQRLLLTYHKPSWVTDAKTIQEFAETFAALYESTVRAHPHNLNWTQFERDLFGV